MKQTGMALVEALVASALLGLGLLGATRLTAHALGAALQTRQEVQAQALAADALHCAVARLPTCAATAQFDLQGVTYTVQLQATPSGADLTDLQARVSWSTARGTERSLSRFTRVSAMPDWVGLSLP